MPNHSGSLIPDFGVFCAKSGILSPFRFQAPIVVLDRDRDLGYAVQCNTSTSLISRLNPGDRLPILQRSHLAMIYFGNVSPAEVSSLREHLEEEGLIIALCPQERFIAPETKELVIPFRYCSELS